MPGVFLCVKQGNAKDFWRCMDINEPMINEEIRDKEVLLIAEDGTKLGVMPSRAALEKAEEADLREMIRRTNDSINRKNKASKVFISAAFGFAIGSGKEIEKVITDADANMYAEKQRQKAERAE